MKINGDLIIDDTNTKLKDTINPTFSYAQMKTSNPPVTITEETFIREWMYGMKIGDFYYNTSKGFICVPHGTAKVIQICGVIAGNGYFSTQYHIQDGNGTTMDYNAAGYTYQSLGILEQLGGNNYWKVPMPTINIIIPDTTKDWYVYCKVSPYNATSFELNGGFGAASWFSVTKLA